MYYPRVKQLKFCQIFTDSAYLMRDRALKVPVHGLYLNLSNFEGVFFTAHKITKKCIETIDFRKKDRHFINFQNSDKILSGYLDHLTANNAIFFPCFRYLVGAESCPQFYHLFLSRPLKTR